MSLEKRISINSNLAFVSNTYGITLHVEIPTERGIYSSSAKLSFEESRNLRNELTYWLFSQQAHRDRFASHDVINEYVIGNHKVKTYKRNDGQILARCSCESKWVYPENLTPEAVMAILQAHEAYDRKQLTTVL